MAVPHDLAAELALRLAGARDSEIDDVVTDALALLADEVGAPRSYITLYHDDGTFENSHEWTREEVVPHRPMIQGLPIDDFPYSYDLARRGVVFAAPDVRALPTQADAERRSFAAFGVQAILQIPIVVNNEGIGLVGFNYFEPHDGWSEEFVQLVLRVGQVTGVTLLRQRANAARRQAYDEVTRANQLKDAFISHVSHELRTPLHAILGYAELLALEERSAHDHHALEEIQSNGRYLLTMVEDLIALSRNGSARPDAVPLGPLLDSTLETLASLAAWHQVSVDVADEMRDIVVHDEVERLRQVLYCVVSSSIRAIGSGGTLAIDAVSEGDAPTVEFRLGGARQLSGDEVLLPMANALIHGYGTIEIDEAGADSGTIGIHVRFGRATDQTTNP